MVLVFLHEFTDWAKGNEYFVACFHRSGMFWILKSTSHLGGSANIYEPRRNACFSRLYFARLYKAKKLEYSGQCKVDAVPTAAHHGTGSEKNCGCVTKPLRWTRSGIVLSALWTLCEPGIKMWNEIRQALKILWIFLACHISPCWSHLNINQYTR